MSKCPCGFKLDRYSPDKVHCSVQCKVESRMTNAKAPNLKDNNPTIESIRRIYYSPNTEIKSV